MRERRSLEKKHLPESVYEVWLHSQSSSKEGRKHKTPAQDLYEEWVKKRVDATLEGPVRGRRAKTG
jgi:hypothetical protein